MTTVLYAQPYDISAQGFHFEGSEEYQAKAASLVNDHGQPVEEFEIQFIDGEEIDAELTRALVLRQGEIAAFFEKIKEWDDHQKRAAIIAAEECGQPFDWAGDPDDLDIDIYEMESLQELAEQFVENGLFGDIPEQLRFYIDHDAIARNLGLDYAQTTVAGVRLVYRCG